MRERIWLSFRGLARLWTAVEDEVHTYGGIALVGLGVWWIYPPASLIAVGLALIYIGLFWRWQTLKGLKQ